MIYVIRHGQTELNTRGVLQGRSDHPLNETGIRQALKMALYILLDKHGAPAEDVQQLAAEFGWLAERINEGRISWSFVDRVLKENDVEVRLR